MPPLLLRPLLIDVFWVAVGALVQLLNKVIHIGVIQRRREAEHLDASNLTSLTTTNIDISTAHINSQVHCRCGVACRLDNLEEPVRSRERLNVNNHLHNVAYGNINTCLLYTSPSPRDS